MKPKKNKEDKHSHKSPVRKNSKRELADASSVSLEPLNERTEKITNSDEQKKVTNKDNEDDPENKPVKIPTKHPDPGGDPVEKEKTKEKIPTSHPGNDKTDLE